MDKLSICFTGLSRQEETEIVSLFKQANTRRGGRWLATPETEARVLVIDMDSMYGQMSLMKALGSGKTLVALTAGARADTDHVLARPVTVEGIEALLAAIETELAADGAAAAAATAADIAPTPAPTPTPAPEPGPPVAAPAATLAPAVATPAPEPAPDTTAAAAAPTAPGPTTTAERAAMPPSRRTLLDFLRPDALPGPVRLQRGDGPELVLDPASQTWLGGSTLKPLVPYCSLALTEADFTPVAAAELPALEAKLGGRHPWSRLAWLCALSGGGGALMPGYNPNDRFKLLKWPQTEREYPKHFRIATVMMKGPAPLTEIAEASGVSLDEVIDYVNASLAVGVAEPETGGPPPAEPAKGGGLLGRFRR